MQSESAAGLVYSPLLPEVVVLTSVSLVSVCSLSYPPAKHLLICKSKKLAGVCAPVVLPRNKWSLLARASETDVGMREIISWGENQY